MFWSLSIQIYFWTQKVFETVFWKKILFSWKKMSSRQENALLHALLCQIFAPPYMRSCTKKKLSNMTPLTVHFCGISALLRKSCCDEICRRILKKTTRHILQMRSFFYKKIYAWVEIQNYTCRSNELLYRNLTVSEREESNYTEGPAVLYFLNTEKKRWDKESTFKSQ